MIVKDEAHCITKCLESVKPIINHWIIIDTGSSDNTEDVVRNSLKDVPGSFLHSPWIDFSTNRNESLKLARTKADYVLIIDADDYLVINDITEFNNLKDNHYNIQIKHNNISYYRPQLIKSTTPAEYKCPLHEYLEVPDHGTDIKNSYIQFGAIGSRSKDPLKYQKDADVFLKHLEIDPYNPRYLFYCAQSFRDAGNKEKALEYYMKRTQVKGWIEESYVALLEAGKLLEELDKEQVEDAYINAHIMFPFRAEALAHLASFHRKQNMFHKAYFYASLARNILKPSHALFLEDACYDWIPLDEMAISSFYLNKKDESIILHKHLLQCPNLPPIHMQRIQNNLRLCEENK